MYEFWVLLIVLAVGCIVSGPIALIISIIALNRSKARYRVPPERLERLERLERVVPERVERVVKAEEAARPAPVPEKPVEVTKEERPAEVGRAAGVKEGEKVGVVKKAGTFEERIGTKWILIAGVIAVFVGVGFFLKYAYDNEWIGPLGRVVIAAIGGLVALVIGEVTRRRGYGIVAKGVTALGFAILYAAVFSARAYYELIEVTPAFILAILITVAAMLCAVGRNELLIAFLSLLGGFLTPVIVSTGENRPMALFSYTLMLGVGAMLCAYYRKWRAVNLLAFVGTFALYTGWFETFYRPEMVKGAEGVLEQMPKQMPIALAWLGAFFGVYIVLPMLYELVKKVKTHKEDVLLVLANAAVLRSRIVRGASGYDGGSSQAVQRGPESAGRAAGDWAVFPDDCCAALSGNACASNGNGLGGRRRYIDANRAVVSQCLDAGWRSGGAFVKFRPVAEAIADAYGGIRRGIKPCVRNVVFCCRCAARVLFGLQDEFNISREFAQIDCGGSVWSGIASVNGGGNNGVVVALRLQFSKYSSQSA